MQLGLAGMANDGAQRLDLFFELDLFDEIHENRCTLKLEYEAITDTTLHKSKNIREELLLMLVELYILRSGRLYLSYIRLLPLYSNERKRT